MYRNERPCAPHDPSEIHRRVSSASITSPSIPRTKFAVKPTTENAWLESTSMPSSSLAYVSSKEERVMQEQNMQDIGVDLVYARKPAWSPAKEAILQGPYAYLHNHPGKDIRSQMIEAFDRYLCVPQASLDTIKKVVGMLHTSSLLVDDVEDSSQLRRGVPCAHAIYGVPQTINTANYVYFQALKELASLRHADRAIRVYADEMVNLHRGQGMDLFWRDSSTCPSEDDYLEMVSNKTGGLFRLAIKLMQVESDEHAFALPPSGSGPSTPKENEDSPRPEHPLIPLVNTIGLLFQILDDYQNLASVTYTTNKGLAEDLTEGKYSFPIIHAIRSEPHNRLLSNILSQRTKDDEVKRYAVRHIESCGSFAYTRRVLEVLTERALGLVEDVDQVAGGVAQGQRRKGDGVRAILERLRIKPDDALPPSNGDGSNGTG